MKNPRKTLSLIFRNKLPSFTHTTHTRAYVSMKIIPKTINYDEIYAIEREREKGEEWKSLGICNFIGFARQHIISIKLFFVATAVFTLHFNFLSFVGFCHFLYLRIASHHIICRLASVRAFLCVCIFQPQPSAMHFEYSASTVLFVMEFLFVAPFHLPLRAYLDGIMCAVCTLYA